MIRYLYILILMLAAVSTRLQAQIRFSTADWETIKQTAVQEQKHIFIDVYTSWCGPCKRMAREVFSDTKVGDYMNSRFICLQLDAEKQDNHPFFQQFKPNAYPTYYWLDAKGNLLDSRTGYMPADIFLETVEEALKQSKGKQLESYTTRWNAGDRDTIFVESYLFDILPQFQPDSVRPRLNQFLAGLNESQRKTPAIGRMVMRFTRNLIDDLTLQTLLHNHSTYRQVLDSAYIDRSIYTVLVRVPLINFNRDKTRYAIDCEILSKYDYPNKELYTQLRSIEELLFSAHYSEGIRKAYTLCQANEKTHPSLYGELCYTLIISKFFISEYTPGTEEIELVTRMARRAFELAPSQNTLSYLAATYARAGNYEKAYQALAYLPFYKAPTLSNAVYPLLGITFER